MALVLLPSCLPWWPLVNKKLLEIDKCHHVPRLIEIVQEIHDICNVGLDPEEIERAADSPPSSHLFEDLQAFIEQDLNDTERDHFMTRTIKCIAASAKRLEELKPPGGLKYSLQQQPSTTEMSHKFVASLLANAFFSTFPNRTYSTHPTLQNFNFAFFFRALRNCPLQKAKLRSLLYYFEWMADDGEPEPPPLRITRKVLSGKQWLTIDDWNECIIPLCAIDIRHDAKIESSAPDILQTIFVSSRIGGKILSSEPVANQESLQFMTCPELIVALLFVEALEDNESLQVENCYQMCRIWAHKQKPIFEALETPRRLNFTCMDAESYTDIIVDQFEEDNFLRELNKCLLTFHQNMNEFTNVQDYMKDRRARRVPDAVSVARRLSPIGESGTATPMQILIKGASSSTQGTEEGSAVNAPIERRAWLARNTISPGSELSATTTGKEKFIVLGSSGECLPVNRVLRAAAESAEPFTSCETSSESSEEFHSAKESVEDDAEDENFAKKYLDKLYTPENRFDFAKRLREALYEQSGSVYTDSTDEGSYGDGAISVKGPEVYDMDRIRIKRRNSNGFVLQEDSSFDESELADFLLKPPEARGDEKVPGNSSKYSFSTDYSSEFSEFCGNAEKDRFDGELDTSADIRIRDKAILHFASSILKRGLSESVAGWSTSDNDNNLLPATAADVNNNQTEQTDQYSRSLSVEFIKQKHRLAAQLIGEILQNRSEYNSGVKIATGNWGCGRKGGADVQLKFFIQWLAASLAGTKILIYHTATNEKLAKLDTICRILRDRKWSVGRLARSTLKCNSYFLRNPAQFIVEGTEDKDFFDRVLGLDR